MSEKTYADIHEEKIDKIFYKSKSQNKILLITNGKFNPPTLAHESMIEELFKMAVELQTKNIDPIIVILSPPKNNIVKIKDKKPKLISPEDFKKIIIFDDERGLYLNKICSKLSKKYNVKFITEVYNYYWLMNKYKSMIREGKINGKKKKKEKKKKKKIN